TFGRPLVMHTCLNAAQPCSPGTELAKHPRAALASPIVTSADFALRHRAARPRAGVPRGDASGTRRSGERARPHFELTGHFSRQPPWDREVFFRNHGGFRNKWPVN